MKRKIVISIMLYMFMTSTISYAQEIIEDNIDILLAKEKTSTKSPVIPVILLGVGTLLEVVGVLLAIGANGKVEEANNKYSDYTKAIDNNVKNALYNEYKDIKQEQERMFYSSITVLGIGLGTTIVGVILASNYLNEKTLQEKQAKGAVKTSWIPSIILPNHGEVRVLRSNVLLEMRFR